MLITTPQEFWSAVVEEKGELVSNVKLESYNVDSKSIKKLFGGDGTENCGESKYRLLIHFSYMGKMVHLEIEYMGEFYNHLMDSFDLHDLYWLGSNLKSSRNRGFLSFTKPFILTHFSLDLSDPHPLPPTLPELLSYLDIIVSF